MRFSNRTRDMNRRFSEHVLRLTHDTQIQMKTVFSDILKYTNIRYINQDNSCDGGVLFCY